MHYVRTYVKVVCVYYELLRHAVIAYRAVKLVTKMKATDLFSIKNQALAALVLQNSFLVIFMRYSRTVDGPLYASSTAVASMEVVKLLSGLVGGWGR